MFASQVAALGSRYRCIVADQSRGGTIPEIATTILGEAPERFALVGFSLGGYIAFEMMRQAPDRIERLALLDTQAAPDAPERRDDRLQSLAMVESGRFVEAEQAHWPKVVHSSRYGDRALRVLKMRRAQAGGPDLWMRHTAAIMDRPDSRPTLANVTVPTLVLVGDEDQLTTPERARDMVAGIADARLVVVPHCGHMAPVERPEVVNAALLDWMTR